MAGLIPRPGVLICGASVACLFSALAVTLTPRSADKPRLAVPSEQGPAAMTEGYRHLDGDLKVDAQHNLVIDLGVRDYFDYFLSAADRTGVDRATMLLLEDADARLDEPALGQLQQLLGDYLDYRRARQVLMDRPYVPPRDPHLQREMLRQQARQLASLRRQYLDEAVVEAFFGAEEAYSRFILGTLDVQLRADLEPAARLRALDELREQLPAEARETGRRHGRALGLQAEIDRLLRAGVSEEQMRGFLTLHYDPPAVERMLAEQREERLWRTRYLDYRRQLAALRRSDLAPQEVALRATELRRSMFSGEELLRVEHYDAFANNKNEASR